MKYNILVTFTEQLVPSSKHFLVFFSFLQSRDTQKIASAYNTAFIGPVKVIQVVDVSNYPSYLNCSTHIKLVTNSQKSLIGLF